MSRPAVLALATCVALLGAACAARRADLDPAAAQDPAGGGRGGAGPQAPEGLPSGPFAPFDFGSATPDWNRAAITWRSTEEGLTEARTSDKPVMMVIHAEWCGPCHEYARVFHDAEVAALAQHFVMILVDADREAAVNQRYATDGTYLPRTYFLSPTGQHQTENVSNHPRFRYFFPQRDPRAIAAAMRLALR